MHGLLAVLLLTGSVMPLVRLVCPMTGQTAVLATLADHNPCDEAEHTNLDSILCPNGHGDEACPSCAEAGDCCCQEEVVNHKQATLLGGITQLINSPLSAGIIPTPDIQQGLIYSEFCDSYSRNEAVYLRGPTVSLHMLFSSYLI